MAKEKKLIPKPTKKDFFYEISGTLTILLCLVLLSELGTVGIILKNLFKVLFGDFYFVVVVYLIGQGIFALVKEKWFDFKSIRFNGFLLFLFSLFLLVHISFIELYDINNQSILAQTIDLYKDSIFQGKYIASYGGGIVGAITSQIFVVLFNKVGALIFAIIFLVLSISFMTNLSIKTIGYSANYIFTKTKKIGLFIYRYFKNINYPTKKETTKKRGFILNLNLLTDVPTDFNDTLQQRISSEEFEALTRLIYQLNCFTTDKKMYVGYTQSRYLFVGNFSLIKENSIDSVLNRKKLFYKDNTKMIIEAPNRIKRLLTLKNLLLQENSIDIPIGIEINDFTLYFSPLVHQNILISGEAGSGIKTFVKSFIISMIFKLKENFSLILCDYLDEFSDFKYLSNLFYPINRRVDGLDDLLDEVTIELEKRLNILNEEGMDNYLSLNKHLTSNKIEEIKPIFIIINNLDILRKYNYNINNKILYFLKFGYKCGIHFILINRSYGISSSIVSNVKTKMLLKTSTIDQSFELIGSSNACSLIGNGDALFIHDISIYHIQLPFISDSDFHRVISKFILN
mgnify:CR=1 FL=1